MSPLLYDMKKCAVCCRALSCQRVLSAQNNSCHFNNLKLQNAGSSRSTPEEGVGVTYTGRNKGRQNAVGLERRGGHGRTPGQVLPSFHSECCNPSWTQTEMEIYWFGSSVYTWTEGFSSIPFPLSKVPWKHLLQKCLDVSEGLITEVRNF